MVLKNKLRMNWICWFCLVGCAVIAILCNFRSVERSIAQVAVTYIQQQLKFDFDHESIDNSSEVVIKNQTIHFKVVSSIANFSLEVQNIFILTQI